MQLPGSVRAVLRNIFGPVSVGEDFCIRTNRELYELFSGLDVAKRINIQRLHWLGHVVRMDEDVLSRRMFDAVVGGHRRVERPSMRWKHQVKEALTSLGVTNWRRRAQSRGTWREALRQTKTR